MATNWEGIAEFLGYRKDQIEEVKALKLPPFDPNEEFDITASATQKTRPSGPVCSLCARAEGL